MGQADQAEARPLHHAQIGDLAFQRVRPFHAKDGADDAGARGAVGQQLVEVRAAVDHAHEVGVRLGHPVQPVGLVQRAFLEAEPRLHRAQLRDHQRRDIVRGVGAVAVVILPGRAFRDGGEDLDGHVPPVEARQVHVTLGPLADEVAVPEQRVGVQVAYDEPPVQRAGLFRHRPFLAAVHGVLRARDVARREHEDRDHGKHGQQHKPAEDPS